MAFLKLKTTHVGIFWFLVCLLFGGCTIHVYHHYVNPPPTNAAVTPGPGNPQPPSTEPNPGGPIGTVDLKDGVQFYLENESYRIETYRNVNGNEEFTGFLAGTRPLTVKAAVGDVIIFRFEDDKITIPPYTVKQLGVRVLLNPKIRFVHSGYEAIIQDANYHSFDLLKVDPIHIDYKMDQNIDETNIGGGMRLPIFENIRQGDIDYVDVRNSSGFRSNYVTKKGFDGAFTRKKWGSAKSSLVYGESNFQQSFSGNLSTSVGMDKVGKAKNSGSFSYTTTESSSYQFIYAFAKSTAELYTITVDPSIAKLSETFKKAVETELPRPTNLPASYEEMANHPLYPQYLDFIKKWGTHYAAKVVYGGIEIAGMEIQENTYAKAKSLNVDVANEVSANIKGVELGSSVGFGYGQDESFKNITKDSKSFYFYKGGKGAVGSWDVDANTVQPIEADFKRLSELLTVSAMGNSMDASALEARRKMLELSISAYIGSETDYGRSLKERRYRISGAYMRVIKASEGTGSDVYGLIEISAGTTVPQIKWLSGTTVWDTRTKAVKEQGPHIEYLPGAHEFVLEPQNGNFNHAGNYFLKLYASLRDEDDGRDAWSDNLSEYTWQSWEDDVIGVLTKTIPLSQLTDEPQQIKLRFENKNGGGNDGGWVIEVVATAGMVTPFNL